MARPAVLATAASLAALLVGAEGAHAWSRTRPSALIPLCPAWRFSL
jgi:hypothetical protein